MCILLSLGVNYLEYFKTLIFLKNKKSPAGSPSVGTNLSSQRTKRFDSLDHKRFELESQKGKAMAHDSLKTNRVLRIDLREKKPTK